MMLEYAEWPEMSLEDYITLIRGRVGNTTVPMHFVYLDEGECVGTVSLVEEDLAERKSLGPWMASLVVKESHRKRGIGRTLVLEAMAKAKELGYERIYLYGSGWVIDWYIRLGWKFLERIDKNVILVYMF